MIIFGWMLDVNCFLYHYSKFMSFCVSVSFCPLCVSVVTFDSEDKDEVEGFGGPSCSSKDDV